jgi:transcriptional regulator with XRE-family HTH domain
VPKKKLTLFGKYLRDKNISAADAAFELGVTRSYVSALVSGAMTPGLKLAVEILRWSRGAVSAESWVKA